MFNPPDYHTSLVMIGRMMASVASFIQSEGPLPVYQGRRYEGWHCLVPLSALPRANSATCSGESSC